MAGADAVFYILPPLMILLVIGTLAQRWIGLHEAYKLFFSSFVFWAGPFPLPGAYILTGLLTVSLLIKFLFFSPWKKPYAGIYIAHLGVLVLLLGGLLSAFLAREGYLLIPEGSANAYVYDYHQRNLLIAKEGSAVQIISFQKVKAGRPLHIEETPFILKIIQTCDNCEIKARSEKNENPALPFQGMARFVALEPKPRQKQAESNLSALRFTIQGTAAADGTYIVFEDMPKPVEIKTSQGIYKIFFGKEQRMLPFSLKLLDFQKENYPGTDMPKAYYSDVVVQDGALEFPARIEMNKPLRYRGYTFYQSSFEQTPETEITVLSVVENKGRLFPYISTSLIAAGLIVHLLSMMKKRSRA